MELQRLPEFWNFVAERQRVWKRRIEGEEPPWTDNEILQNYRFTNVYRELDPGTQYAIQEIMARDEPARDRAFNVMVYRLIGRSETHEDLGFLRPGRFDRSAFESALKERREEGPVFTGAYLVSGYSGYESSDKVENVSKIFEEVAESFDRTWERIENAGRLKDVYEIIRELPGFGNFLSYQVTVDLLYENGDGSILPFNQNDWAKAGPGAKKGLELLADNPGKKERLEIMRWLTRNQQCQFDTHGIEFDYVKDGDGLRKTLSLADIQNCLCEFYKYHKIENDKGRARRKFRLENAEPSTDLRSLYRDAPDITL
ncbi:MAG: nucleotide kinase domain-containing protein [Candidatus Nanohaloarchaea archaeon]